MRRPPGFPFGGERSLTGKGLGHLVPRILTAPTRGMPTPRLVRSKRGLDMALPSGEVIDYTFFRSELIGLGIFTFKVAGVWV